MTRIAPSILSADFAQLGPEVRRIGEAGADLIHVDVMDGVFVPNISFGMQMVKRIRPYTEVPFDVHLMIREPWKYAEEFIRSGADWLTIHLETSQDPQVIRETLRTIRRLGTKAGLSIKPATPAEAVEPFLEEIDLALVMTVEPGFGNQKMMPDCLAKVPVLHAMAEKHGRTLPVSIDGGVNLSTLSMARESGCDWMVAGSAVFGAEDPAAMIRLLRGE